jgi:large conductance mechanosensitive channel
VNIVGFLTEFMDFMKEQKVLAVALAFILGFATKTLVDALVADIITPVYSPYMSFLDPNLAIEVGKSKFMIGHFIREIVNWIVVLLVVFIIAKKIAKTQ